MATALERAAQEFMRTSIEERYSYNFNWLGRPIIQYPQDIVAVQELVFDIRPDLIIETGIAHGGSLILSASLLTMLDYADAFEANQPIDPRAPKRKVLGIDIDIREHNRAAIQAHAMAPRIEMIQGSSIAPEIVDQVRTRAEGAGTVLVFLDSNHTHEHVLEELKVYAPMTSVGSYCVVFDTVVEDLPDKFYADRPWSRGDNPKTAVWEYLNITDAFEIDREMDRRLAISVAPEGYLKRVR
jgi:cephalosporin hydroxylase